MSASAHWTFFVACRLHDGDTGMNGRAMTSPPRRRITNIAHRQVPSFAHGTRLES